MNHRQYFRGSKSCTAYIGSILGDHIILLHIQIYQGKILLELLCLLVEKQKIPQWHGHTYPGKI